MSLWVKVQPAIQQNDQWLTLFIVPRKTHPGTVKKCVIISVKCASGVEVFISVGSPGRAVNLFQNDSLANRGVYNCQFPVGEGGEGRGEWPKSRKEKLREKEMNLLYQKPTYIAYFCFIIKYFRESSNWSVIGEETFQNFKRGRESNPSSKCMHSPVYKIKFASNMHSF